MPGTLAHPVRDARPSDAESLARLLTELGYPVSPQRLGRRLQTLSGERGTRVFVVASEQGELCGVAAMHCMHQLELDDPACRLTTLAVAPEARRRGVGRALMARIDREARGRGCVRIEVASAQHRTEAHEFYERLGFEERPRRFVLELRP
jgi:N-acetylglutamate synthase-like GNAT family acetyltransferase